MPIDEWERKELTKYAEDIEEEIRTIEVATDDAKGDIGKLLMKLKDVV